MLSILSVFIFILVLFSGPIFSSIYFKTKFEQVLPIACALIIFISFIFGILGILKISTILILTIALFLYVFAFIKLIKEKSYKTFIKNLITPGFVLYCVFCLVFLIAIYGKLFDAWDEFSHWGDIVKVMSTIDDFGTNHNSHSMFKTYPPGMSLFQYILEKINYYITKESFVEWLAYFGYYSLATAFLMPITSKLSFKNPLLMLGFAGAVMCVPYTFYNGVYYQLYIDPFLGFLIAAGALQLLFNNDELVDLNIYAIIFMLTLAKDAGLAFAIFLLIAYIVEIIIQKKNKKIIKIVIAVFSLLIPKLLWNYNTSINNANNMFSSSIDFKELIEIILGKVESYRRIVLDNFIEALHIDYYGITLNNFGFKITYLALFIIACIGLYLVIKGSKQDKYKRVITYSYLIVSTIIFIFGTCVSYMYKFSEYEALALASFDRYMCIVFLGLYLFLFICAYIDMVDIKHENIICLILVIFMCLCAPVEIMLAWMYRSTVRASKIVREPYTEIVNKTMEVADNSSVWFVAQETTGGERLIYRFSIRPNSNDAWWSIGEPDEGDEWTVYYSADEWKQMLKDDYDYVALYKLNDYFYDNYSCVFTNPDDIKENCIYSVDKNTGMLTLCK